MNSCNRWRFRATGQRMANSPHDALFRHTFAQVEHAAPLLRAALSRAVAEALDWSTLRLLEGTRVGPHLLRSEVDLLFVVGGGGRRDAALLHVLVEHSSRIWRFMALRMLAYSVGIWRQWLRQRPRPKSLPQIFPIVVHHGRRGWWAATEFTELLAPVGAGSEVRQPGYRYTVLSTAGMTPAQIEALELTSLGTATLVALQFLPGAGERELAMVYAKWGGVMQRALLAPSGEESLVALSEYVLTTTRVAAGVLIEIAEREVSRRASKIMESTALKLRRQGREEGREEGVLAGSRRLLRRQLVARFGSLPETVERRLAAATAVDLDGWALGLLDAGSLADVFGDDGVA